MGRDKELSLEKQQSSNDGRCSSEGQMGNLKLWDTTLGEGPYCIQQAKHLVKTLCHHWF